MEGKVREDALRAVGGDPARLESEIGRLSGSEESMAPVLEWASRRMRRADHDLPLDPLTYKDVRISGEKAMRGLVLAYLIAGSPARRPPVERGHLRVVADATKERSESQEVEDDREDRTHDTTGWEEEI